MKTNTIEKVKESVGVSDDRERGMEAETPEIKVDVIIKGITPLLQNRKYTEKAGTKRGVDKESEEYKQAMFENSSHKDKDGYYAPVEYFEQAIFLAGKKIKIGKQYYSKLMKTGVTYNDIKYYFNPDCKVERFDRFVVRGADGQMISKSGPRIHNWELKMTCFVNDDRINLDAFRQVWDVCGHDIGIGSWIPKYGRFKVVGFTVHKNGKKI